MFERDFHLAGWFRRTDLAGPYPGRVVSSVPRPSETGGSVGGSSVSRCRVRHTLGFSFRCTGPETTRKTWVSRPRGTIWFQGNLYERTPKTFLKITKELSR